MELGPNVRWDQSLWYGEAPYNQNNKYTGATFGTILKRVRPLGRSLSSGNRSHARWERLRASEKGLRDISHKISEQFDIRNPP